MATYQRHDINNDPVVPGALIDINAFVDHDINNVAKNPQPGSTTATDDYGNQYKNWAADYVPHGINNEDLSPTDPITITATSTISGIPRDQEVATGTLATFTGGTGTLVIEGRFERNHVQNLNRESSTWEPIGGDWSTTPSLTYTIQPDDVGYNIRFATRVVDDEDVTAISVSSDHRIYSIVSVTTATQYTGAKKVDQTLDVTVATATGGIPPLNYLLQVRTSPTGSGSWTNQTLKSNTTPGTVIQYTIPESAADQYIQLRTRIRDAGGADSSIYQQVWSSAPTGDAVAAHIAITAEAQISGDAIVNETLTGTAATFSGGYGTVTVESKFICREDASTMWHDCTPWSTETSQTYTLISTEVGKEIGFTSRAVDGLGEVLASIAGPLGPTGAALSGSGTTTLSGTFEVGQTVTVTSIPTFSGGKAPVVHEYQWQMSDSSGGGSGWVGFDSPWTTYDPSIVMNTPPTKVLTSTVDKEYIRLQTRATDALGVRVIVSGTVYGRVTTPA